MVQNGIIPESSITGAGFALNHYNGVNTPHYYEINKNALMFLGGVGGWNSISPIEAKILDEKADDGMAGTGKIRGATAPSWATCSTSGNYILTNANVDCVMHFILD